MSAAQPSGQAEWVGGRAPEEGLLEPAAVATLDMLGRTGARDMTFYVADPPDLPAGHTPTVWVALATWEGDHARVAAGLSASRAIYALAETTIDGGTCTHCQRPTAFLPEPGDLDDLAPGLVCTYAYDPERHTIRRGCE